MRINNLQFGFMGGMSLTECYFYSSFAAGEIPAKKKDTWMAFVDSEKAFDMLPRKVV